MGDPKRQRRKFDTPRHPWREGILTEELNLLGQYGLRNKKELWRHKTMLTRYRTIARSLLGVSADKRARPEVELIGRLSRLGLVTEKAPIDDVLDLTVENILERRLQTQVFRLGLARSPHQARQLINHGHISVAGRKVTSSSYLVLKGEENQISFSSDSSLSDPEHPIRKVMTEPSESGQVEAEQR